VSVSRVLYNRVGKIIGAIMFSVTLFQTVCMRSACEVNEMNS
jgi:hypothetical protein